ILGFLKEDLVKSPLEAMGDAIDLGSVLNDKPVKQLIHTIQNVVDAYTKFGVFNIVMDRSYLSSLAYSMAWGLNPDFINTIYKIQRDIYLNKICSQYEYDVDIILLDRDKPFEVDRPKDFHELITNWDRLRYCYEYIINNDGPYFSLEENRILVEPNETEETLNNVLQMVSSRKYSDVTSKVYSYEEITDTLL